MGLRRRHFWIFAFLALLAAVLVVTLSMSEAPIPSQRLPDGTVVSIAKVSYGRIHSFTLGNLWERIADRVLPEALTKRVGLRFRALVDTNAADSTFIFVQSFKSNGTFSRGGGWSLEALPTAIVLADDAGNDFRLSKVFEFSPASNLIIEGFRVPLVSHTAGKLHLQLQRVESSDNGRTNGFVEFDIKNPAPYSAPRWTALPLPQTNVAGNLTVELIELKSFPGEVSKASSGRWGFDLFPVLQTRARIRLLENGGQTDRWRVAGMTVVDEDGNIYETAVRRTSNPDIAEFEGGFSVREPRKFRFELARVPPFDPDETATLTNINVPAVADSTVYRRLDSPITMDFQGFKLKIDRLTRVNDFQHMNMEYNISPSPRGFHHHIVLKSVEGNGKETILLDLDGGGAAGGSMGEGNSKPLMTEPFRVDLVFALTKNRTVEFLARPEGGPIKNSK